MVAFAIVSSFYQPQIATARRFLPELFYRNTNLHGTIYIIFNTNGSNNINILRTGVF